MAIVKCENTRPVTQLYIYMCTRFKPVIINFHCSNIYIFLRLFSPEGQDWTGSTMWLILSPFLSGEKIPGENQGEI